MNCKLQGVLAGFIKKLSIILIMQSMIVPIYDYKTEKEIHFRVNPSEALARLIGHLIGDGGISNYYTYYDNTNKNLLNCFKKDCFSIFGNFKIRTYTYDGVSTLRLPRIIGRILTSSKIGFSKNNIPQFILNGNKNIKSSFIKAIFDDESSVIGKVIRIEMTNRKIIYHTRDFLKEFGIYVQNIHSRKRNKNWKRSYYYNISGKSDLIKFYNYIGFGHPIKRKKLFKKINSYKINQRKNNQATKEIISLLSQQKLETSKLLANLKIKAPCLSTHLKKLKEKGVIENIKGKIERDEFGRIVRTNEDCWRLV